MAPVLSARQQPGLLRLCGQQGSLPKGGVAWPVAGPQRQQRCRAAASARRRRQPRLRVAASSAAGLPHLAGYGGEGGGDQRAARGSSGSNGAPPPLTLSDVIDWTINLPWQKAASWVAVAVVVSQLRDFFGVS